jgi:hypothetical protein
MTYSTFEAVKILGVDYTRLNEWLRGYFEPHQRATGRGTRTRFTLIDLYRLQLFAVLVEHAAIPRGVAKMICSQDVTDFTTGFLTVAKDLETGRIVVSSGHGRPNLLANLTEKKTGKIATRFPVQMVISLPVIKQMVDSRLE